MVLYVECTDGRGAVLRAELMLDNDLWLASFHRRHRVSDPLLYSNRRGCPLPPASRLSNLEHQFRFLLLAASIVPSLGTHWFRDYILDPF